MVSTRRSVVPSAQVLDLAGKFRSPVDDLRIAREQNGAFGSREGYRKAVRQRHRVRGLQCRGRSHGRDSRQVLVDQRTKLFEHTVGFLLTMISSRPVVNLDQVDPADCRSLCFEDLINPARGRFIAIEPGEDGP